jgi:hypothetical protein
MWAGLRDSLVPEKMIANAVAINTISEAGKPKTTAAAQINTQR